MAMHKPKKQRRFQDGGDVDEAEMKRRGLDISNRAREEGTEKTGFFQRLREGNIDDPNSAAYKKYGAGRARLDDQIVAAKEKLAGEVQEMVKAKTPAAAVQSSRASDGDVDERDRLIEAAASAPKRMPTRPGQGAAKAKRSDDATPKSKASTPAVSSSYRTEGANKAKPAASSGSAASTAPAKKPGSPLTALPMNPSLLRQRDEAEKKRDAARAARRAADEAEEKARPAKEAAQRKMLSEQPGAVAYRKKREEQDKMSPGQRSAARGKALKEFFGMKKGGSINGIAKRGLTRCKTV